MQTQRCALWLWYRGDLFRGFQAQVQGPTVQQTLERALRGVGVNGHFAPSGRTDKGVHARMQILSGRARADLSLEDVAGGLRRTLGPGLGTCVLRPAPRSFHAQWSCIGKEYRYRLALGRVAEAWRPFAWAPGSHPRLEGRSVDAQRLAGTLASCEGTHDFIAFHEKSSVRKARRLDRAELIECGEGLFEVRLRGAGFARYQARYMVGSAVAVAAGVLSPDAFAAAVERAEPIEGVRAPAESLVLWEALYPPALDPLTAEERAAPPGLPPEPPFSSSP